MTVYPVYPGPNSTQHLPNELWLQIISTISEEPEFQQPGAPALCLNQLSAPAIQSLATLRLVNRNLASLVAPALFRDVELDFSRKYISNPPRDTSRAAIRQIRRVLAITAPIGDTRSEFLSHTTHLRISAVYDVCREISFRDFVRKWFPRLLDAMPKLREATVTINTFYVDDCVVEEALEVLAKRKPQARVAYEMRSCTANPISSFPSVANLVKLTVWSYGNVEDVILKSLRGCPKLRELWLLHVSTPIDLPLNKIMPLEAELVCGLEKLSLEYCCHPIRIENLAKLKRLKEVRIGGASPFLAVSDRDNEKSLWKGLHQIGVHLEAIESVDWSEELLNYIFNRTSIKRLKFPLNRRLQANTEAPAPVDNSECASLRRLFWHCVLPSVQNSIEELSVLPTDDFDGELNAHHWRLHREFPLPMLWNPLQEHPPIISSDTLTSFECFVNYENGYFPKLMEIIAACSALKEFKCLVLRNITQRTGAETLTIPNDVEMFESALSEIEVWRAEGGFTLPGHCWMEVRVFSFYNRRQEYWRFRFDAAAGLWRKLRMLRVLH